MLLLYCMTEAGIETGQMLGVRGSEVLTLENHGVACHFSARMEDHNNETQANALAFWAVIDRLFRQDTVIPFRYPTLLPDESAIQDFLTENGNAYLGELQRMRGMVQAKITIGQPQTASTEATIHTPANTPSNSGTEYLKKRQQIARSVVTASDAVKGAGHGVVQEWKQSEKKDATILFALVDRKALPDFKSRISQLKDFSAQISFSGPWPPAEFVKCSPELPSVIKNG